jgi:methanol metabolism-related c-type cytochrome
MSPLLLSRLALALSSVMLVGAVALAQQPANPAVNPAAPAPAPAAQPAAPAEAETPAQAAANERDPFDRPYVIVDGKVDQGTYNGFRRYHASCHVCHGPEGLGSSFAPALVESLKAIDYTQFMEVVVNGRANLGAQGDRVMPPFANDPNVMNYIDDIYGYLKARSDGALGQGRPTRIGQ